MWAKWREVKRNEMKKNAIIAGIIGIYGLVVAMVLKGKVQPMKSKISMCVTANALTEKSSKLETCADK